MIASRRAALAIALAGALAVSITAVPQAAGARQGPSKPPAPAEPATAFGFVGRYSTGLTGNSAEIAAITKDRLYVSNADAVAVDVVDITNPATPARRARVELAAYGASVTSVAVSGNLVAAAVAADPKTDPGTVVVMNRDGGVIGTAKVGALPDSLVFTPDGRRILVPNEGEPNSYGQADSVDPEGTVSIVNVPPGIDRGRRPRPMTLGVRTVDFRRFNEGADRHDELPAGVRVFGPGATVAQDLEPEYITVTPDGRRAYVALQENNALAIIDVPSGRIREIVALGEQDHAVVPLDPSDRDSGVGNAGAINIATWDGVKGMRQPDNVAAFVVRGRTYVLTANEGDARDYDGFAEEERARDVADTAVIPAAANNAQLGRLTVTTAQPATASPPSASGQTELYAFGSRSFSILDADGGLVWDSGDLLEQVTARVYPGDFNSTNDANNSFDTRSDNKGPEPEAATTGKLGRRTLAFVGLERQGGVVVMDVSDPTAPTFVQYLVTRDFAGATVGPDSGPESISYLERGPGRKPLVAVSNEITGTVSLFTTVAADGATELSLLHNNDGESSLLPFTAGGLTVGSVAGFKSVTDREIRSARDAGRSVVNVYAGDAFLAGATLTCSNPDQPTGPVLDAIAQRRIAYDAHVFGNHEFDFTPTFLERFVREFRGSDGRPDQPFLSANLDFSGEPTWADLLDADGLIVGEVTDGRVVARSSVVIDPTTTARVGRSGVVAATMPTISSPGNVVVTSTDIPSTAAIVQDEIDALTALGVDKIAVVSHLQDISNDVQMVGLLTGVDVAVAGGGDELLANPSDPLIPGDGGSTNPIVGPYPRLVPDAAGSSVPLVTTNGNYKYVGRLDVAFDADGRASVQGGGPKRVVVSTGATPPADSAVPDAALVAEVEAPVRACLSTLAATPVADTEVAFDRSRTGVRTRQSNAGNLVSDAWLDTYDRYRSNVGLPARTPNVIALQNGGGIRDNGGNFLPSSGVVPGTISRLDVINMLPFDNTMSVVSDVGRADLKQILERSITTPVTTPPTTTPGGGQFLQIAGFTVVYDTSRTSQVIGVDGAVTTEGDRVRTVTLADGTPIVVDGVVQPGPALTIVTNNFTAGGGDNYPWLRDNPNKTVLRAPDGLGIPYERAAREYLASFPVGSSGLPTVPATAVRYAPFPTGGDARITILPPAGP